MKKESIPNKDLYQILSVETDADLAIIRVSYLSLIKLFHSDKPDTSLGCSRAQAEEIFRELNEAYEWLSDEEKRRSYDLDYSSKKTKQRFQPSVLGQYIAQQNKTDPEQTKPLGNTVTSPKPKVETLETKVRTNTPPPRASVQSQPPYSKPKEYTRTTHRGVQAYINQMR